MPGSRAGLTGLKPARMGPFPMVGGDLMRRDVTRSVSLLIVTVFLVAACGGSAAPATSAAPAAVASASASAAATPIPMVKLKASYGNISPANLAPFLAQEAGYFKQNRLDVDLQFIEGGAKSMAALLSNGVDIANLGGTEAMSAYIGGADISVTALFIPVSPWALYVPASYRGPEDLKGKNLGIVTKGGSSEVALRDALKQLKLDPDKDVTIQAIGGVPALAAAMISGVVYAGPGHPPDTTNLTKAGFKVAVDLAKQNVPATDNSTVVKRSWATANKDVMQRYIDSLVMAIARAKKDKPFAVTVLKKMLSLTDDVAAGETYDFYVPGIFPLYPHVLPAPFNASKQALVSSNAKVADLDVTKVIDDSFVLDAEKRGVGTK